MLVRIPPGAFFFSSRLARRKEGVFTMGRERVGVRFGGRKGDECKCLLVLAQSTGEY